MKRTIIIISIILGTSFATFAQRDTVGAGYPYYFPTYIDFDTLPHISPKGRPFMYTPRSFNMSSTPNTNSTYIEVIEVPNINIVDMVAIKYVPDSTIHIVGIAYGFYYQWPQVGAYYLGDTITHVVTLWRTEGTYIMPVDSVVEVVVTDSTLHQHVAEYDYTPAFYDSSLLKYFDLGQSFRDYYRLTISNWERYPREYDVISWGIKEAYFPNEINLSQGDTFYISAYCRYHKRNKRFPSHYFITQPRRVVTADDSIPIYLPLMEFWARDTSDYWYAGRADGCLPLIWAIIRRDCDSCPQARGLRYIRSSTNKAFFKWQRGTNHHDWQISYGPAGTLPEDGTLMDCKQMQSGLVTLDPDSHYVAYVRAHCKFARYEYGPWSAPLNFSLNGGNGIDDIGLPDITLTPNPASEQVTVAATGMQSVELLAVDGTVIMRREGLMQDEYSLDLKGLAAGLYMVRVSTPLGTATRRLLVQ